MNTDQEQHQQIIKCKDAARNTSNSKWEWVGGEREREIKWTREQHGEGEKASENDKKWERGSYIETFRGELSRIQIPNDYIS